MVVSTSRYALVVALAVGGVASAASSAWSQSSELLAFSLPTCGPCRAMAPTVRRLAAEGVSVRRVDGSREPEVAQRFRVSRYPTFVAVVDGQEVGRVVGATSYEALRELAGGGAPRSPALAPQQVTAGGRTFAATSGRDALGFNASVSPAAPAAPSGALGAGDSQLLNASVRLTINDANSRAYGTGTIVDARQGEALVVTCAHLFRGEGTEPIDTAGKLSIELFEAGPGGVRVAERVSGQLVSHDFESDVALVAIRTARPVAPVAVMPSPGELRVNDVVKSVGCDHGADPTVRQSRVVALNRYQGPPNIEASGAPVQGRSGGGLFDANGRLAGVCNFADAEADEGIYAGLASIHTQLDRVGLTELYRGAAPPAAAPPRDRFASTPPPATDAVPSAGPLAPVRRSPGATAVVRGQNAIDPPADGLAAFDAPAAPLTASEQATMDELLARGERSEVVILIRPENAAGKTEVLTLDASSPEFVAALRRLGGTPTALR